MDKTYQAPTGRLLPTLVLVVFIVGLFYAFFLFFQKNRINKAIQTVAEQQLSLEGDMATLESQDIENLFVAQELKNEVTAERIQWSKAVRKIQEITPVTVFFSSYQGSPDGTLQLSGLGDGYGSVADMISALDKSSDFENPFVPSVSLGTTGDGQEVVSFTLSFDLAAE